MDIPSNMPFGNSGIRVIDFIRAVQKKFNLIIYADKTNPNQFIVETFNNWYKSGRIVDFNNIINLSDKIEYVPANQLGYRQIKFSDAQDNDYISTIFKRTNNRTYGESNFYDTDSFYSQGTLNVNTEVIASGPLNQVPGSVYTGSLSALSCNSVRIINTSDETITVQYDVCGGGTNEVLIGVNRARTVCATSDSDFILTSTGGDFTTENLGSCGAAVSGSGTNYPVWIPYYISDANYAPARVLPRIYYYNGLVNATPYYISGYTTSTSAITDQQLFKYPYFDNYSTGSGSILPTVNAKSLLFNNEVAAVGSSPNDNLITDYWQTYLELLYNPRTRLVNCTGVIPLGQYVELELNDIAEFRGSYYHIRAINDYNLKTGECNLQLLGPIIADTIGTIVSGSWPTPVDLCDFNFTASVYPCTTWDENQDQWNNANVLWNCGGTPQITTIFSSSASLNIPDNNTAGVTSSINVTGITGSIVDIAINVSMSATWVGDVSMNLQAPNGSTLNLVRLLNNGTGNNGTDNFTNTVIGSNFVTALSGAPAPRTGNFAADAASAPQPTILPSTTSNWTDLYGTPNGTWKLGIADLGSGDPTTLHSWYIAITYL